MARIVSWFCCDSDQYNDPKLTYLPDNDYRWTYQTLLCLEKQGKLDGQDVRLFCAHCRVDPVKFSLILESLRDIGLLNEEYRPNDFDGWQRSALRSERNKRYNTSKQTQKQDAPKTHLRRTPSNIRPSDTDTDTDTKIKNTMSGNPDVVDKANEVLAYLNQVTGKNFRTITNIEACIKREKCGVDDCKIVIDSKWKEWAGTDQQKFVDPTTPFRKSNFMRYLDTAMAGEGILIIPAGKSTQLANSGKAALADYFKRRDGNE